MRRAIANTSLEYRPKIRSRASASLDWRPAMSSSSLRGRIPMGWGDGIESCRPVPHTAGNASARPFKGELIVKRVALLATELYRASGNLPRSIHQNANVFPDKNFFDPSGKT